MNHLPQQSSHLQCDTPQTNGWGVISSTLVDQPKEGKSHGKSISDETRHKYKQRARKGGYARARRYETLKSAITDVIENRTPQAGWLNYIGAARIILNDLEKNHAQVVETSGLKYANLLDTIVRWLKNDSANRFKFRLKNQPAPESTMS